ncbi:hypothetical protein Q6885_000188 [Staphylococcus pseudintermedius]|nr:hypothetical protein [Staphylococcus pseudintermedius]ELK4624853.1 hypothetical protein [Staphylococcus pseudintermedius]
MLKVKEEILKFIVNTCVNKDQESIKTYEFGIGKTGEENVDNGRAIALWNMIYNNFINNGSAAGIVPLKIHRGNIWTAVAAYIESTGEFIMVFKKANLKKLCQILTMDIMLQLQILLMVIYSLYSKNFFLVQNLMKG